MPPEISHGGGGIMDLPCDDPANQGSAEERYSRLKQNVRKKVNAASNTLRLSFRKMGAAGSGKIGKYEFRTALRNLNLGVGMQDIVDRLFHEIDSDGSGSITFQEFAEAMKDEKGMKDVVVSRNLSQENIRPLNKLKQEVTGKPMVDKSNREEDSNVIMPTKPNVEKALLYRQRPVTPRNLAEAAGNVSKRTNIPARPKMQKRSDMSRPYSAGKPGNKTIAVPMQTSRKPRWRGSRQVGRSAPHRMIRKKYESRRRQKGNIIDTLKRRYMAEAQRNGVVVSKNSSSANPEVDLSSILGVRKL